MIVISDTSPINYLCRISRIDLLPALFGRVIIPTAVAEELSAAAAPETVRRFISEAAPWWEIRQPLQSIQVHDDHGAGEIQAIALAEELRADLLIVDDHAARQLAAARGIAVTGVLGVLKLAAENHMLDFLPAVDALIASGFYVSDDVVQRVHKSIVDQRKH